MSNAPVEPPNPYAAPQAVPAVLAAPDDKARRVNLINRRTAALLLEVAVYYATVGALVVAAVVRFTGTVNPWLAGAIAFAPYYALRDVLGPSSFGKRLMGLRLVRNDGSEAKPSVGARIVRNLVLLVPGVPLIEYFVAYYGNASMERLGDKLAGTRVEDVDPRRYGRGSYSAIMLGTFVLLGIANYVATRVVLPGLLGE